MSALQYVLLLGILAAEAVLIYVVVLGMAKAYDAYLTRRLAAERGEGPR